MGEALEIAKVLVSPTMKLMDMVGSAIGTAYKPRHKRKMADASVYEINAVAEAMRNAVDMPIVYNKDGVAINSEDFSRLMQGAGTRLALQETIKQHNIECVVDNAYAILEKEDLCSEEPVEQGWINRFFDSVADISDEDLQTLWGRVLAGEIKQPKSYSLRTLETLKNLSKYEAELFRKLAPFVLREGNNYFLLSDTDILSKYNINYGEILQLDECGLVNSGAGISLRLSVSNSNDAQIFNQSKMILLEGLSESVTVITIGDYNLTKAGIELYNILDVLPNEQIINDVTELIELMNPANIKMSVYKVKNIENNKILYENAVLHEFPAKREKMLECESTTVL